MRLTPIDLRPRQGKPLYVYRGNPATVASNFTQGIPPGLVIRLRSRKFGLLNQSLWPQLLVVGNVVMQQYTAAQIEKIIALGEMVQREYCWFKPNTSELYAYIVADIEGRTDAATGSASGETIIVDPQTGVAEEVAVWDITIQQIVASAEAIQDAVAEAETRIGAAEGRIETLEEQTQDNKDATSDLYQQTLTLKNATETLNNNVQSTAQNVYNSAIAVGEDAQQVAEDKEIVAADKQVVHDEMLQAKENRYRFVGPWQANYDAKVGDAFGFRRSLFRKNTDGNTGNTFNRTNYTLLSGGYNYTGAWVANTDYYIGDLAENGGNVYERLTDGQSGSTFSGVGTNWKVFIPGASVADGSISRTKMNQDLTDVLSKLLAPLAEGIFFQDPNGYIVLQLVSEVLRGVTATFNKFSLPGGTSFADNEFLDLVIQDPNGYIVLQMVNSVLKGVAAQFNSFTVGSDLVMTTTENWALCLEDPNHYVVFGIDWNFRVYAAGGFAYTAPPVYKPAALLADMNLRMSYGQSLSLGSQSRPALTTTQVYNSLMFLAGTRPWDNPSYSTQSAQLASLVALSESDTTGSSNGGETPLSGWFDTLIRQIESVNGVKYTDHEYISIGACPGQGSTAIAGLSKGTTPYTRLLAYVTAGMSLANAAGKTFNVPSVAWTQGENDYATATRASYTAALSQLYTDLNTDIKAITGQTNDIALICYQPASHNSYGGSWYPNVALAILDLAISNPNIYLSTPLYIFPTTDNVHLTNTSSRRYGTYIGLAEHFALILGTGKNFVYPKRVIRQGAVIEVQFNVPSGKLVLDTATINNPGNYGFRVLTSGGTDVTLSSVSLVRKDTVRIVCASSVSTGMKLTYAINGTGTGPINGSRGCLRDNQGDTLTIDGYAMHNWCPIFDYTF